jgi:hypothetical protein
LAISLVNLKGKRSETKMAKNWIKDAVGKPGALHKQLGVPEGEKIPEEKLNAALAGKYGELAQKRARLAKTLKKINKSPEGKKASEINKRNTQKRKGY